MSDLTARIAELSPEKRQLLLQRLNQKKDSGVPAQIRPQSRDSSTFPLSFAQQRLWFFDQLDPGNPTYNIFAAVRLTGKLNASALERSLNEVARRHEALRTVFVTAGGQPVGAIAPSPQLALPVTDLRSLPDAEREAEVRRRARAEAERPFDLARGPLVRASLLQLSESEWVLLFATHHIISDGWSMGILIQELATLYHAFCEGGDRKAPPLPELDIQYADFAIWQRQWLQGEVLETQLSYWKKQLAGSLPVLDLPADRQRPAVPTYQGGVETFVVPPALTEALTRLSQQERATLFMTLLAAFKVLLYRYTGQEDICAGSPIANRNRREIEGLIGFFANTLVLRTHLDGNPTFRELLGRVRQVALGAYSHQDLPFEKLVEVLQPERNLSHNPLFQVLFSLRNLRTPAISLPGLQISPLEMERTTARVDLALDLSEGAEGLKGTLEYSKDLFDTSTAQRMVGHFLTLLESAAAGPDRPISTLPLLTKAELQQQLVEWNSTQTEYSQDKCLHELFEAQAERTPDAIAVVFQGESLTYRQLNRRANQLAHHLQQLGVKPEVLVGIYVERSLEMVVGMLGILKAGGAYLPLDPAYSSERLAFMLGDAGPEVVLTQSHLRDRLPRQDAPVVCLDSDWEKIARESEGNPASGATDSRLAYVIYTSGSTGRPKGVEVNHRSAAHLFATTCPQFQLSERDAWTVFHSYAFDFSVWEIWGALLHGCKLVVVPLEVAQSPAAFYDLLCEQRVTVLNQTPSAIRQLAEAKENAAGTGKNWSLRLIVCGGEALPKKLAGKLLEWNVPVWNFYGPTEATVWAAASQVKSTGSREGVAPIGRPLANTQFYILDPNLQPVPVGVFGELHIGGAGLARGYLNRPELTAEKFIPNPFADFGLPILDCRLGDAGEESKNVESNPPLNNPKSKIQNPKSNRLYKTGDFARYRPDGTVEFLGRSDSQVKVRGFRIELGEIEAALAAHPEVRQVAVTAREDSAGDKYLVAYVVPEKPPASPESPNPQIPAFQSQLRSFLQQKLPYYMVPSAFVLLGELPVTPNGKIDRRALPAPDTARAESESDFVAPRTPDEEAIARIWAEVIGLDRVSVSDNFFELGGHSLLATQVISRLREAFQIELPLRSLFESPTVASLSETVAKWRGERKLEVPPIRRASREGELPLSFAQQRLWFLDQLQPGDPAYNIPAAVRLRGDLNVGALAQSFSEVVQRHEALRTAFISVEGEPVQVIIPSWNFALPVIDLRELPPVGREAEAMRLAAEEARRPFDLAKGPLLRVSLLQLDGTEYLLLLTVHHIVADGWSMGVIVREVAALYEAFCAGKPSPLPELAVQYADFAIWQRQWLSGEVLQAKLAFWKQQLGTNLPVLELPFDRPRSAVSAFRGASQSFQLSPQLSQEIAALCRQEGVTLFMTLLAAFQTLLHRYTKLDDIVVGTDLANRTRVETEALIGFFVNLLVLRTHFGGNPSFRELLAQVRERTLAAYAHQDLPFEKLVEELRPDRRLSHTPLFQVLFVLQNAPVPALEIAGLTLTPLEIDSQTAKFDLAVFLAETEGGISGTWKYNAGLFDAATVEKMSARFETLLGSIVAQPDARINTLEFLTETERQQQAMQEVKREKVNFSKFKAVKPKVVSLPQGDLVKTEFLQAGETFPLVVKPAVADLDIADWAKNSGEFIETKLLQHGAILFRGFAEPSVPVFEQFASAICPNLFGEYGDLPREGMGGKVYGSTPYPADRAILFHSESSHLHRWPMKIWFFCVQPAQQGGETPIADCRKLYQLLDPKLRERFQEKQIMYVRNFTDGLDVSWQDFFKTEDRAAVEDCCRQAGIQFEWKEGGGLRTSKVRPAIAKHPKTGEMVFFNQLPLHHVSCLDPAVRASLLSVFGESNLPRNVYWGDGSPIEDSVMAEIQELYDKIAVCFPWQAGDIIMLDNMLAAHSRNPFVGPRKIVVAMGEMIAEGEL